MRLVDDDRREHERYKIENSVSISSIGIFQITDVSMGGFCFRCPPYTSISDFWETDILTSVENLKGVPTQRAWLSVTENGTHDYLPTVVGVKFGKLTQNQEAVLSQIIRALSTEDGPEQ